MATETAKLLSTKKSYRIKLANFLCACIRTHTHMHARSLAHIPVDVCTPPHRRPINHARSEAESSLSTTHEGSNRLHDRPAVHRDTVDELQALLEALDQARSAVQLQLDSHFENSLERRR